MKPEVLETLSLPNPSVRLMCDSLARLNIPVAPLLARAGITEPVVSDPRGEVLGIQELQFQQQYAESTRAQPHQWFQVGLEYRAMTFPLLGPAMLTSDTAEEGLSMVATFQALTYDLLQYGPYYDRTGTLLGMEALHDDVPTDLLEFVWTRSVAAATTVIRDMCPSLPLTHIDLPLPRSPAGLDIERELGVPIRYGSSVLRFALAPEAAQAKPCLASPLMADAYRKQCAAHLGRRGAELTAERVVLWLMRTVSRGPCADEAAAYLGVSRRTLYRQLRDARVTYGELVDRVRKDRARVWLKYSELPIETIALRLGFSDHASFSRAFKRWNGRSPTAFRLDQQD